MSYFKTVAGEVVHFPPTYTAGPDGIIPAPPSDELEALAKTVRPDFLLRFASSLVSNAGRRRGNRRYLAVNRARLQLAQLCLRRLTTTDPAAGA